jgi:hypothetical protein
MAVYQALSYSHGGQGCLEDSSETLIEAINSALSGTQAQTSSSQDLQSS